MSGCEVCGGLLREDREFAATAARYGEPGRRYVCPAGHSIYSVITTERVTLRPPPAPGRPRTCAGCPRWVRPPKRYCNERCRRRRWKRGVP